MSPLLRRGRHTARYALDAADLRRAQALRHLCFVARGKPGDVGIDADRFDAACRHVLIEDAAGALVCCFRILLLPGAAALDRSHAATVYDLAPLHRQPGPMLELGRFCVAPGARDADPLRLAWAVLAGLVDRHGITLLFGCSSFSGTDPAPYADAFARLAAQHQGPVALRPGRRAGAVLPLAQPGRADDPMAGLRQMPPLLRSYLAMGGWVGDHAVIDRHLDTLHVFTGLQIAAIPAARARALRAIASEGP